MNRSAVSGRASSPSRLSVSLLTLGDPGTLTGGYLYHRRLARRLGDNARQLALERFTWQACAQRCLAAYPRTDAR